MGRGNSETGMEDIMDALATIQRLGTGRLIEELYDALVTAAEEVVATGKPATVTLALKISNKSQGDPLVIVDEVVSRSSPRRDPRGAMFFAVGGTLHRDDPRQAKLEFRAVDKTTGEIREIDAPEKQEREIR